MANFIMAILILISSQVYAQEPLEEIIPPQGPIGRPYGQVFNAQKLLVCNDRQVLEAYLKDIHGQESIGFGHIDNDDNIQFCNNADLVNSDTSLMLSYADKFDFVSDEWNN